MKQRKSNSESQISNSRSAANQNYQNQAAAQFVAQQVEEEEVQAKSISQRMEEEEVQAKPVMQQVEEEEVQAKMVTQKMEEEEVQGKFKPAQLQKKNTKAVSQLEGAKSENKTGMPDSLKSGIENLSGMDVSDVRVHYNSDKPAQMNAHAFAQGTNIHVAAGQEKHLPHEAWHTVQQKQGRVAPTTEVNGTPVNDNVSLETEADVMGAKANSAS